MRGGDFISSLTRDGLLERLEPIVVEAKTVINLPNAGGQTRRLLKRRFRGAKIVSLDGNEPLPFEDGAVDAIFANLLVPRIDAPERLFAEVARVLRKEGLFVFSAFGPDTLPQLNFPDMHDIGDELVRAGLRDPVLDVERMTLNYEDPAVLSRDLAELGVETAAIRGQIPLSLELELVYGHCWGPGPVARDGSVRVDPAQITRR